DFNGQLFFFSGAQLYKSDGTTAGTVALKSFSVAIFGGAPSDLTNVGGTLYFRADDGVSGVELWKSDGTAAGTVLVKDIFTGKSTDKTCFIGGAEATRGGVHCSGGSTTRPNSSFPASLTDVNGRLYFTATNGDNGKANGGELWTSDGTAAGTVL